MRVLGEYSITTQRACKLLEDVYTNKVMGVAKKLVAKQLSRDLARMQMETVSSTYSYVCTATYNPLFIHTHTHTHTHHRKP